MAMIASIKNLSALLSNYLKNSESIVTAKVSRLTKPGENYGSIMLKIDITLNDKGQESVLHAIAKLIPTSEVLLRIFNTQVTFKYELEFYRTIVPTLQEFQRKNGIKDVFDCVAKFIAGRINLNDTEVVDNDAVLMLENLREKGYRSFPRTSQFDYKTTMLLIRQMVIFHTVPLALKLKNPLLFESNIKPYIEDFRDDSRNLDKYRGYITSLIHDTEIIQRSFTVIQNRTSKYFKEPWATLIHNDLWITNFLIKFENDEPVDAKIVDFQECKYKSPARDLIFFLFSSVRINVLEQHLNEFLSYFYELFIENLRDMKVDTSSFTWDSFNEELKLAVSLSEYYHVLWMIDGIHKKEEDLKDISEYTEADFGKPIELSQVAKDVIVFMTNESYNRGWI